VAQAAQAEETGIVQDVIIVVQDKGQPRRRRKGGQCRRRDEK